MNATESSVTLYCKCYVIRGQLGFLAVKITSDCPLHSQKARAVMKAEAFPEQAAAGKKGEGS